jgi:hypothetical protein
MADGPAVTKDLERAQRWFADKGLGLRITRDPYGVFWADLVRHPSGELVAPQYGRGVSAADAAVQAGTRF